MWIQAKPHLSDAGGMDRMVADLDRLWNETLSLVELELPRPHFETWLRQTQPVAFYDDLLIVAVPSDFARGYIADKFSPLLAEKLALRLGRPINLEFVTPDRPMPADEPRAEPPDGDAPAPAETPSQPLNPKYSFETFVTAPNNHLSYSAAVAVAEAPARVYNPLFIYGGVGLGKTHLLQAVARRVLQKSAHSRIFYISTETFANELINAIKDRTTVEFRNRYRSVDVLLVDDVQFLAGKESTQEEFFHTFNALYEANRQIVLSSDRPPREIATLEERLRSRFEWGLITDIQPPDLETRIAILRKKAEQERLHIPDEAVRFIAERITSNIRELEGALIRVVAFSSLHGRHIDADLTHEALKDILPQAQPRQITIRLIQEVVAGHYALEIKDFKIRKRTRALAFPRQVAMYLCRELTDSSLPRIGDEFGGRDHTTVIHAYEKISHDMAQDASLRSTIDALRKKIVG
jgi:chromosomal replication initiator protein